MNSPVRWSANARTTSLMSSRVNAHVLYVNVSSCPILVDPCLTNRIHVNPLLQVPHNLLHAELQEGPSVSFKRTSALLRYFIVPPEAEDFHLRLYNVVLVRRRWHLDRHLGDWNASTQHRVPGFAVHPGVYDVCLSFVESMCRFGKGCGV